MVSLSGTLQTFKFQRLPENERHLPEDMPIRLTAVVGVAVGRMGSIADGQ